MHALPSDSDIGAECVPSLPCSNCFSFPEIGIAFDAVDVTLAAIINLYDFCFCHGCYVVSLISILFFCRMLCLNLSVD